MRQSWSDDRIDGLERKVDEGFRHVDQRFEQVDKRFEQVDQRFERVENELVALRGDMNSRFESLETRFDLRLGSLEDGMRGFHRTLMMLCVALFASLTGLIGTFLTIMLTQL